MDHGVVWEPSTRKEAEYYNKLFQAADADNSGTLDGKETIQFLGRSGLTKTQLKNVWSVANSPGQAELQRHEFYVAMRTVALAQGGEATLSRQRVQETAADSIAMATFKGIPAPPLKQSKGKKQQPTRETKAKGPPIAALKQKTTTTEKDAAATPPPATKGELKNKRKNDANNNRIKPKKKDISSAKNNKDDKRVPHQDSAKTQSNGMAADTAKKQTSPKLTTSSSSDSSSSSGAASESDGDRDENSRSAGEGTDDGDNEEDCVSGASGVKSGDTERDEEHDGRSESGHSSSHSERSASGKKGGKKSSGRGGGGKCRNYDDKEEGGNSDSGSSRSGSGFDSGSSAGSSKSLGGGGSGRGGSTSAAGNDKAKSRSASTSSTSSSFSAPSEEENLDPFSMSAKARARYQAVFRNVDAAGTGSLGGKQVLELCLKSGLDKAILATIWRLSDLDEDGSLTAEEFGIAFHLIFCATQRKLEVPDELPSSLWPADYVPPSVLARRKEETEQERKKEERERREKEETAAGEAGKTSNGATVNSPAEKETKKKKREKKKKMKQTMATTGANKRGQGTRKEEEEKEVEERKEQAAREAASQKKKEELAKKRAEKTAKNKGRKTRIKTGVRDGGGVSSTGVTLCPTAEADAAEQPPKKKGAPKADAAAAAVAAVASPRSDASDAPSSVGGSGVAECNESPLSLLVSDVPSSMAERSDIDVGGGAASPVTDAEVGPLTMAERRARKAEFRAAKLEASRLKLKEIAARDARLKEMAQEDRSKAFNLKAMKPMETSENSSCIHVLSDPGGGGGGGGAGAGRSALAFSRLSAPLPYLTPHPGRPPCVQPQEHSVSFPSGVRRASSLTPSLEIRLGPPPVQSSRPETDVGTRTGHGDDGGGLIRCPECAEHLARAQIVRHIRSTCRLFPCELCSCLLLPVDRERHLEGVCPNRRRSCTRCGEALIISEFARHEMEGGCSRRAVPCAACGDFCFADELTRHEASKCPGREVRCPSCGDALPAKSMDEHASSLCRSTAWTCGCGRGPFPLVDRPSHLKSCNAFIDAWEASIEKVMISTRVEDPRIALLALAESEGSVSLASRRAADGRAYIGEICLAADVVNVEVFLKVLKKPGKRGAGALWRAGL
ncbi:unnamed protein product [Pylaiella littoralis]